ncbi:MAG: glycosyltransferase family 4 protein [Alistipes sp.]|nr:glycosyltransferase family 4 protein [Alistipes sp.]
MKILILGPAHPYRGGLASIMHTMAREYQSRGHEVEIYTFTVQHPSLPFPGKTQFTDAPAPEDLKIERVVNTTNPFNWVSVGLRIKRERPDIVLMKYWTPFMAPCFGTIARIARSNGHTKVLCQIDNVEPHEHHIIDKPCNRYYLGAVDGFVYMSEQVHSELKAYSKAPMLFSPHPMFENFGTAVSKQEACDKIGIDPSLDYTLFFGLIRDYKGLDMLLRAWAEWRPKGRKLLVAGEFYASREKYIQLIEDLGLREEVVLHDRFIADEDVRYYFSAADSLALPYRTATQSGVTQIAYNFSLPMIVTRVGGLPEIVPDGKVGIVCEPTVDAIKAALQRIYEGDMLEHLREGFVEERKRFSWSAMCDKILEVYNKIENNE